MGYAGVIRGTHVILLKMVRNVFTKKGRDSRMGVFRFNPEMGLYSLFPSKGQKLHGSSPLRNMIKEQNKIVYTGDM